MRLLVHWPSFADGGVARMPDHMARGLSGPGARRVPVRRGGGTPDRDAFAEAVRGVLRPPLDPSVLHSATAALAVEEGARRFLAFLARADEGAQSPAGKDA